ncbi:MAG: hypothetical protein NXY57DRAFT_1077922 [Lentinula lateritia]|nr:MAG: hypothetical protein NXY57DRAFT_1077922 [Lentinula lateritia]
MPQHFSRIPQPLSPPNIMYIPFIPNPTPIPHLLTPHPINPLPHPTPPKRESMQIENQMIIISDGFDLCSEFGDWGAGSAYWRGIVEGDGVFGNLIAGFQAKKPLNEDKTVFLESPLGLIIALFDGHHSDELSDYASKTLPFLLFECIQKTLIEQGCTMDEAVVISLIQGIEEYDRWLIQNDIDEFPLWSAMASPNSSSGLYAVSDSTSKMK